MNVSAGVSCRLVKLKGIEFEFVKARTAVFMSAATQRQKVAQLRRIEGEFCRRLAHQPRLKLEVRRRIAETLLDMSISRGQTLATWSEALDWNREVALDVGRNISIALIIPRDSKITVTGLCKSTAARSDWRSNEQMQWPLQGS